jgi:K+-sensing histidine kinase KdpD
MHEEDQRLLSALRDENARLHEQMRGCSAELQRLRIREEELVARVASLEQAQRVSLARSAFAEEQAGRLSRLYVASYRLNEARAPQQVLEAIQEIISDLIGSEELCIFRLDDASRTLSLVLSAGIEPESFRSIPLGRGPIGRAALTGETFVASTPLRAGQWREGEVSACVPLSLEDRVHGAIAIFGLLPQKQALEEVDHELLALLAMQAGPALQRVELYGDGFRSRES